MKYKAAYIKWLDHAKTEGDPKTLRPVERHCIGWVVKETDTYVTLSMDVSKEPGGKADVREYGYCIVKSLIIERAEPFYLPRKGV